MFLAISLFGVALSLIAFPIMSAQAISGIPVFVSGKSSLYNDWLYPYGGDTYDATPVPGMALGTGDQAAIVATGCATLAGANTTCISPAGQPARLYRGLPVYSLIGAWSTSATQLTGSTVVGKAFYVGASATLNVPTGAGPFYLFLGVNDGYVGDNKGGFDVVVTPIIVDADGDGIKDTLDNCPSVANADQADLDVDGLGDLCDDDIDGDGIVNGSDNCPAVVNADQADVDVDGTGDLCDDDIDGDVVLNDSDNCPFVSNADQADIDSDNIGDLCDDDIDADGILNGSDNCPSVANADQADLDGDTIGNLCDDDLDGDGTINGSDNCPAVANADQADFNSDGAGDMCDFDPFSLSVSGKSALYNDWLYPYGNDTYDATPVNGLVLPSGHQVQLSATGCATLAGANTTCIGPAGQPARLYRGLPVYSLIGAWSTSKTALTYSTVVGKAFYVGAAATLTAPTGTGPFYLFLGINDGYPGDNKGSFTVQVTPIVPPFADYNLTSDQDNDEILNARDLCPNTPELVIVDRDNGCSIDQFCPCDGPRASSNNWKSHSAYVSCIARASAKLLDQGSITSAEKRAEIADAAESECGQ
jgi:hypothetical protein